MDSRLKFYLIASSIVNAFLVILLLANFASAEICLPCICEIESACMAYPEGREYKINGTSGEKGAFQIMPATLTDYNRYNKEGLTFTSDDLYDFKTAERIANFYVNERIPKMITVLYGIQYVTEKNIIISYNWGIGNLGKFIRGEPLPFMVKMYVEKYFRLKEAYYGQ